MPKWNKTVEPSIHTVASINLIHRAVSSVVERLPYKQVDIGSNPILPKS